MLVEYLSVSDLVAVSGTSTKCRDLFGRESIWRRVARRLGLFTEDLYMSNEYGQYVAESKRNGIMPLCKTCFITIFPAVLKRRWRKGDRRKRCLNVPTEIKKDIVVCYDVCENFAVIGTMFGRILVWKFFEQINDLQVLLPSLEQRVD